MKCKLSLIKKEGDDSKESESKEWTNRQTNLITNNKALKDKLKNYQIEATGTKIN